MELFNLYRLFWLLSCPILSTYFWANPSSLEISRTLLLSKLLSKILPFQSVPDIQLAFSRLDHIYSCNLSNPDTYDIPNVHNSYFSTSDMNQMFTKATTNFSVFHLNICSLAKNFQKLQDFVSILDKAPSCIAISETWLISGSAIVLVKSNFKIIRSHINPPLQEQVVLVSTYKIV